MCPRLDRRGWSCRCLRPSTDRADSLTGGVERARGSEGAHGNETKCTDAWPYKQNHKGQNCLADNSTPEPSCRTS
ncbi:protein of unknown function [Modestobacter italicus]|uniref:Uncharacterized protein n=1 Tax=Modestobacter italicus (strain DSM 44449 / CECT 9708 / BC 501) TaxID=2732864 RepID=I4F0S0_MODI5|nr:protein of unknown function [Modestobacter marinus]